VQLISNSPVAFYLGGEKAIKGYKRKGLLPLANPFSTSVYSTGPSPTVSEDVQ
jgi:hypothetical protein